MQLDFPTLFIIILLNAFSLLIVWALIVARYCALISARYWLAAVALKCASGPLLFLGYGVTWMNHVGLTLVTLAFALVWQGVCAFYNDPRRPVWVGLIGFGTFAAFFLVGSSQITINIIAALTQIACVGLAAAALLRAPQAYIGSHVAVLAAGLLIAGQGAEAATNFARLVGGMDTDAYYNVAAWFLVCAVIGGNVSNLGFLLMTMNRAQDRLTDLAGQDDLTGLPNRRGLRTQVAALTPASGPTGSRSCVMVLDVDRFKHINDELGHDAGDEALVHVSRIIRQCLGQDDLVARLGGDEFCIVLNGADRDASALLAARVVHAVATTPFRWRGQILTLSVSVGLSEWSAGGQPLTVALKRADEALLATKRRGRDGFTFFESRFMPA